MPNRLLRVDLNGQLLAQEYPSAQGGDYQWYLLDFNYDIY
ncbi:hypothetical protein O53_3115 [Microcystis aeruginosa TAIHU98]|uniref:Uncharacterized protein n=1 Tax=Microcystis aeruginosa TAIHU98 TaxID=1134457 RepID=L7E5H3_MICAE|nr:hypothetical protein O53_3115 [Microcystis aeruginosa TAIHU98]ELS45594.1 hypothetical protein C789_4586 [Microcystis aeruginosa FACHB-905 = DIANCHI905]